MTTPFDLDAAVGTTTSSPFPFTWGGQTFLLPQLLEMSVDRQLAITKAIDGLDMDAIRRNPAQLLEVLELVVGADLLAEIVAAKPLPAQGVIKLLDAWMAYQGGAVGKSPASRSSSASTAPRSKPTSRSARAHRTS